MVDGVRCLGWTVMLVLEVLASGQLHPFTSAKRAENKAPAFGPSTMFTPVDESGQLSADLVTLKERLEEHHLSVQDLVLFTGDSSMTLDRQKHWQSNCI